MTSLCSICCHATLRKRDKRVRCPASCAEAVDVCTGCVEAHVLACLDRSVDPVCMFCAARLPEHGTLLRQLGYRASFCKGAFSRAIEARMVRQQRGLYATTQPRAEHEAARRRAAEELAVVTAQKRAVQRELRQLQEEAAVLRRRAHEPYVEVARPIVRMLPCGHPSCGGASDAASGLCRTCCRRTCVECGVALGDDDEDAHVCHVDDRETLQRLNATRPCPGCGVRIERVEGCDAMFCTLCHTPFNWATGERDDGGAHLHNPHYLEQRRNASRDARDIPCGARPSHQEVADVPVSPASRQWAGSVVRLLDYYVDPAIAHYRRSLNDHAAHVVDLRVQTMLGRVDDDALGRKLRLVSARSLRDRSVLDVLDMFATVSSDLLRHAVVASDPKPHVDEVLRVVRLADAELHRVSRVHGDVMVPRMALGTTDNVRGVLFWWGRASETHPFVGASV